MTGTYYLIYYPSAAGGYQAGYSNVELIAKKAYELCHIMGVRTWNVQKGSTTNHAAYQRNMARDGGAVQANGGWVTNGVYWALHQYESRYGEIQISTTGIGIPE